MLLVADAVVTDRNVLDNRRAKRHSKKGEDLSWQIITPLIRIGGNDVTPWSHGSGNVVLTPSACEGGCVVFAGASLSVCSQLSDMVTVKKSKRLEVLGSRQQYTGK